MRIYYLYTLNDPITNCPKYVGISNNPTRRFVEHLKDVSITKKTRWIKSLKDNDLTPKLEVIKETPNVREVINAEIQYIENYKIQYELTNSTMGGEYYAIGTPIQVFNMNGEYIETFTSMIEYCELYNIRSSFVSSISAVCLRKRTHAQQLIFRYLDDYVTAEDLQRLQKSITNNIIKKLYVFDLKGNLLGIYNSIEAAVKDGIGKRSGISEALSWKRSHCHNKLICNNLDEYQDRLQYYYQNLSGHIFKTPLNQYTLDGQFVAQFWTYSAATKQFNTNAINIIKGAAIGKYSQAKGYIWKFAVSMNDQSDICVNIPDNIKDKYKTHYNYAT